MARDYTIIHGVQVRYGDPIEVRIGSGYWVRRLFASLSGSFVHVIPVDEPGTDAASWNGKFMLYNVRPADTLDTFTREVHKR